MGTKPSLAEAKKEIERLRQMIRHHDRRYFVENQPEITDQEYDRLFRALKDLEEAFPQLITPDSPTQRVAGQPLEGFKTIRHRVPMMSLGNTYSADELREFDARVKRFLSIAQVAYVVELKFDGVSVSLTYRDGRLVQGATRGDGEQGDDITANLKTLRSIPVTLERPKGASLPRLIEVRGEAYLPRPAFEALNRERKKQGVNPRTVKALSKVLTRCDNS